MCTVTFIPCSNGIYLTSNRDERHTRSRAVAPAKQNGLIYPEDKDARGSWIVIKENGDAAVLLNGAFRKHLSAPPYRKSRGLILLEIIQAAGPARQFEETDLAGIEPFTLIIYSKKRLYECRWDGSEKHCIALDTTVPQIWSSATLYDGPTTHSREDWFREWNASVKRITTESILHFHRFGGTGDPENDLVINRNGLMATASITSVHIDEDKASLTYLDLKDGKQYYEKLGLISGELIFP